MPRISLTESIFMNVSAREICMSDLCLQNDIFCRICRLIFYLKKRKKIKLQTLLDFQFYMPVTTNNCFEYQ